MLQPEIDTFQGIRRARNYGLPAMAELQEFFGGHGRAAGRTDLGAPFEPFGLFQGQLRVGITPSSGEQPAEGAV